MRNMIYTQEWNVNAYAQFFKIIIVYLLEGLGVVFKLKLYQTASWKAWRIESNSSRFLSPK